MKDLNRLSAKSGVTSFTFKDDAANIIQNEGRVKFRSLMREMGLTHLRILRTVVDV